MEVLLHHIEFDEEAYPLASQTVEQIRELQKLAEDVSDKAIPYVENLDPQYYKGKYSKPLKETAHQIIRMLTNKEHDELSSLVKNYINRLKNKTVI